MQRLHAAFMSPVAMRSTVPVAHTVDGADDLRRTRIDLDPLPELRDLLVERAARGEVVDAPAVVEDRVAIEGLPLVSVEDLEDLEVPEAQVDHSLAPPRPLISGRTMAMFSPGAILSRGAPG